MTLLIVSINSLHAQQPTQRQTGIYKTYQEFLDNKPGITKAFMLMSDTSLEFNESTQKMDTVVGKLKYVFNDGSKTVSDFWGLCDSDKVYIKLKGFNIVPVAHLGKYPYTYFVRKPGFTFFIPLNAASVWLAASLTTLSAIGSAISPDDLVLVYIDEKGKCYEMDTPRMFKILRPQKDLHDAFWDEKKKKAAVYEKYLRLINERYATNP